MATGTSNGRAKTSNKEVEDFLRLAQELGWTSSLGGRHISLVPPGGLTEEQPTALSVPKTPSDWRWLENTCRDLRAAYGETGKALADAVKGRGPRATKGAPQGTAFHEPAPPAPPLPQGVGEGVLVGPDGVTEQWEEIDRRKALEYLATNYEKQRTVRYRKVDQMASDMMMGNWMTAGDPLRFADNGTLIDGQHRLQAIVESNTKQWFKVMRGLPVQVYDVLDSTAPRTLKDRLDARGETNTAALAAAISNLYRLSLHGGLDRQHNDIPSAPLAFVVLDAFPGIRDSLREMYWATKRYRYSYGKLAALHYVYDVVDAESAKVFFEELRENDGPHRGPTWLLERTMVNRLSVNAHNRNSDDVYAAYWVKAFNAFRRSESPRMYGWKPGVEKFPTIWDPEDRLAAIRLTPAVPGLARLEALVKGEA